MFSAGPQLEMVAAIGAQKVSNVNAIIMHHAVWKALDTRNSSR